MTDLPTQNPYPFMYLKCQKGTFQEEHSCTCHSREYPHLPWGMTIVFLFCSKGMSLVYSFSGVALWFCVCESSLRQSATNQEEFSVYLLAEYHIACNCLGFLKVLHSLSHCLAPFYHRKHKKNLSLEFRACENTWARIVGKSSNCLECTPINCMCD